MLNHDLQTQAVTAAKNNLWQEAVTLNQQILDDDPTDVTALNRLGIALLQINKPKQAQTAFQQALKIDAKNKIAKKNLEKLKHHHTTTPNIGSSQIFVEEPGKTKFIKLHRLAGKNVLEALTAGNQCELRVKKRYISIEFSGQYVGALPEDISFRLTKLINTGNRYACYIKNADHHSCCVYLKEIKKSKRNLGIHSFPINGLQTDSGVEIKELKEEYQQKVPFEVINLEQDDETKPPINAESTVVT
jgi:tetratricopeptide (TPR) repeat protein